LFYGTLDLAGVNFNLLAKISEAVEEIWMQVPGFSINVNRDMFLQCVLPDIIDGIGQKLFNLMKIMGRCMYDYVL
jgi:hypothetical protein